MSKPSRGNNLLSNLCVLLWLEGVMRVISRRSCCVKWPHHWSDRCAIYFHLNSTWHTPQICPHCVICIVLFCKTKYSRVIAESRTSSPLVYFGPHPVVLQPVQCKTTAASLKWVYSHENLDDGVVGWFSSNSGHLIKAVSQDIFKLTQVIVKAWLQPPFHNPPIPSRQLASLRAH